MRSGRLRPVLLALAGVLLALLLACGLGAAGVRVGRLPAPEVDVSLGAARLIGRTTVIPYCSQLIAPDCISDRPRLPQRVYTLWLFIRTERNSWQSPQITRLLTLSLGEASRRP